MTTVAEKTELEQLNIVTIGHVDHGKSTVIGRLLADTGSLPEGKLEDVRQQCKANARPFEYAFLLDALKNEQAQGITIDTARCFFHTDKRRYIINDAPGHIEFLKNMVTGAARAEAALLVIDAEEGVQENSKRHGYMASMLGIKQLAVVVNKMDLVDYNQNVFQSVVDEYSTFLEKLDVIPQSFIPVSARDGENMIKLSDKMPWYDGLSVVEQIDAFERPAGRVDNVFRMPVQDIYKFTAEEDDRRIVAGTIDTGRVSAGDEVIFYPSGKTTKIKSIEGFNTESRQSVGAGRATGFTTSTQIYIKPGELMCRRDQEPPIVGSRFRANLFWMGHAPMVQNKQYKLKLGSAQMPVELADIYNVLDASELSSESQKAQVDRHDVAECRLETYRPLAFDRRSDVEATGRFVIVDGHEIAGCGIILEPIHEGETLLEKQIQQREYTWDHGLVKAQDRAWRNTHQGRFIVFTGSQGAGRREIAKKVEQSLFNEGCQTYYLSIGTVFEELEKDKNLSQMNRDQHLYQLGGLARLMTDSGHLFIATLTDVDDFDLELLKKLNEPNELFVVNVGENHFTSFPVDVQLPAHPELKTAVKRITDALTKKSVFMDYSI